MSSYLCVPLPRSPTSGRRARQVVLSWLIDVGRANAGHVAALVVTELVTNAVIHGAEPISLHLWLGRDGVRLGVSDGNAELAVPRAAGPTASHGRGLHIVNRLASRWGSEARDQGKLTWAEISET
jgi:two-component sensor histidine kinase